MKWYNVRVPEWLKEIIRKEAGSEAEWKVLARWIEELKKPRIKYYTSVDEEKLQKLLWYFFKVTTSYAILKERFYNSGKVQEQLRRFREVVEQIRERVGLDLTDVYQTVERAVKFKSTRLIVQANDMLRAKFIAFIIEQCAKVE